MFIRFQFCYLYIAMLQIYAISEYEGYRKLNNFMCFIAIPYYSYYLNMYICVGKI